MNNEREVVNDVLMEILEQGGYNNISLRTALDKNESLSSGQKAFVTEVVNGILRNYILIDHIINSIASLSVCKMKPYVRNSLRSAVYQLKFMDNAKNYAVCNETVMLVKKRNMGALAGFVNGILRNILRMDNISSLLPEEKNEPAKYISIKYSVPQWLVEMWIDRFGYDETKKMCEINNTPPAVSICVNTLKTDVDTLTKKLKSEGANVSQSKVYKNALRLTKTANIAQLEEFLSGGFHIMDESAMLAVLSLNPQPNEKILDICAAPGGKSFMSAYMMQNKGEIISNDIHDHKIKLIQEGAFRLKTGIIKTSKFDAEKENSVFIDAFDKVLVDAPCTGYGVIRKKPDIKIVRNLDSQKEMSILQKNILTQATKYVKRGGVLVYSTCTLTSDENEDNAEWFEKNFPFKLIEQKTILPQHYDSDGFYIASFRKEK